MAALDGDNCIKFFRLEDDNEECENILILPGKKNILKTMFDWEYNLAKDPQNPTQSAESMEIMFPDDGVNLLVKFRHELDDLFRDCGEVLGIAAVLWEDISRRLFEWGFTVTGQQCSNKWVGLWAEYCEIAHNDDEARVSAWKHFSHFENLYKLRSKYIDSKILEDITEYLNSRSHSPATIDDTAQTDNNKTDLSMDYQSPKNVREDFSASSNDYEESQMLMEAINAAEKILEENLKESDDKLIAAEENPAAKKDLKVKPENVVIAVSSHTVQEEVTDCRIEDKRRGCEDMSEHQIFVRSKCENFYWDSDSTQCFIDLRLHVETSKETKNSVLAKYRTIVAFVSQKMLLNGYQVSQLDCKKKWDQLLRYYNTQVKSEKRLSAENGVPKVRNYFWQMDKVLKKSKLRASNNNLDFSWDDHSIKKLIEIRIPMENAFTMFKRYIILWQYVASQMAKNNFSPTYNECSIKWMSLCEMYQICLNSVQRGTDEKHLNWKFYHDMRKGFAQNSQSKEATINYKCPGGISDFVVENQENFDKSVGEKSTLSSLPSAVIGHCGNKLKNLRNTDSSNNKNGMDFNIADSSDDPNFMKVHSCTLRTPNKIGETIVTKTTVGESELQDLTASDNNVKTQLKSTENLNSLTSDRSLLLKQSTIPCTRTIEDVPPKLNSEEEGFKPTVNNKWTEDATALLIKLKLCRELRFQSPSIKEIDLWKEIAEDMRSAGHNVSHNTCASYWMELKAACKENKASTESGINIHPKFYKNFGLPELQLPDEFRGRKAWRKIKTKNCKNCHRNVKNIEWTDEAIRNLLEFKFSRGIISLKKYGSQLANKMQNAGYSSVTPIDVTRKWSRMYSTYRKSLFRRRAGQVVKWQYFDLVDKYMRGILPGGQKSDDLIEVQPFSWTHNAVKKLIELKLSMKNSGQPSNRKSSILIWKKISDKMIADGFKVTRHDCSIEWNFLIEAYKKTNRELSSGNGAVLGMYFIMIEEALERLKITKSNKKVLNMEEPIDFSIKRLELAEKAQDNCENKYVEQATEMHEQQPLTQQDFDQNVMNLSFKVNSPPTTLIAEKNEENNIAHSEKTVSCIMPQRRRANLEKIEKTEMPIGFAQTGYEAVTIVDNIKKNPEMANCQVHKESEFRNNLLIQDRSVNSTEDMDGMKDMARQWDETATRLLIDLKLQHNRKFLALPRPEMSWEDVAKELAKLRYYYTAMECKENWIHLKNIYKAKLTEIKEKGFTKPWLYFAQIDSIYNINMDNVSGEYTSIILNRKRFAEDVEKEDFIPRKKFILPSATVITPALMFYTLETQVTGKIS